MFKLTVITVTIVLAAVVAMGQAPTLQILTPDGPNLPADLYYGSIKVKPLRLRPGTNQVITIDDGDFFVNQQYVDFLNRFPDQCGFDYWNTQVSGGTTLASCGSQTTTPACNSGDTACINQRRVNVSNAFFFEQEFQQTGSYTFRLYRAAFGNSQPFPLIDSNNQAEANKLPLYVKFKADRQQVIGGSNLAAQQLALATDFASRAEFTTKYPASLTLDQFVTAISDTIKNELGADLTSQHAALVALGSRGAMLYRLADDNIATNPINNRPFIDAEYNRAFVYTQYAGYFRRDADILGYLFWLGQVNSGPLRDTSKLHKMVCSQLTSDEYQLRFGTSVTHHNSECNIIN